MRWSDYTKLVNQRRKENPPWRIGQTYFNVLNEVNPELADAVRGTKVDPYYEDGKIYPFLDFIWEKWDRTESD